MFMLWNNSFNRKLDACLLICTNYTFIKINKNKLKRRTGSKMVARNRLASNVGNTDYARKDN